ncbi:hypothetical protein D3C81_2122830 [compost metagenome]
MISRNPRMPVAILTDRINETINSMITSTKVKIAASKIWPKTIELLFTGEINIL